MLRLLTAVDHLGFAPKWIFTIVSLQALGTQQCTSLLNFNALGQRTAELGY